MTYDDWKTTPPDFYEPGSDEGVLILESAMEYLKPRADADYEEQLTGEWEAYSILLDAKRRRIAALEAASEPDPDRMRDERLDDEWRDRSYGDGPCD